jgi:AcrR family transcriptional regulator
MPASPLARPGRRRSPASEAAILKAAADLLKTVSLRDLTIQGIAARAGVGKATVYKWWPDKNQVALDAFLARMREEVAVPDTGSAERDFTLQLQSAMAFYRSSAGRTFGQFLAEGQNDPAFLRLFRERFLAKRRDAVRVIWERGVTRGEIRREIDGEIVLDLIHGPMIYRLLAGHAPIDEKEAAAMVAAVFRGLKA